MRFRVDMQLKEIIEAEFQSNVQENRDKVREKAKEQIMKIQEENRRTYNLRHRTPTKYKQGDLIANVDASSNPQCTSLFRTRIVYVDFLSLRVSKQIH